jgi:hypothetical protein
MKKATTKKTREVEYSQTISNGYAVTMRNIPTVLSEDDVSELKEALASWCDEPDTHAFRKMLADTDWLSYETSMSKAKIKAAMQIEVVSKVVNRERDVW